jgi:hypothetical protein
VYITLYNIPPHYYMPPATKKAKKQQEKASHARSIRLLHQSRLVSPAASAGPDPSSSAAPTPPISSAGSDVEPADFGAGHQSDVDGRNSKASSPDAIVISDTSDAENADDGYGSDDMMSEMDGEELKESLQLQMQGEIELLEQSQDAKKSSAYEVLMREIKPDQWTKAESKRSLGYNGQSRRTQQRRNQQAAKAEEENMKTRAS